jgi:translocation and assembly module TamA
VRLAVVLAAVVVTAWVTTAAAQTVRYRVEVEAPEELKKMLQTGLTLVHWERDPQMTLEQLRRLTDDAVREAREAAATEGWFAARVTSSIDEAADPRIVRIQVDPGERAKVGDVEIRFRGPATTDAAAKTNFRRVRQTWPLRRNEKSRS